MFLRLNSPQTQLKLLLLELNVNHYVLDVLRRMTRLSEEETNLLLAITSSEGRYQTSIDRKCLEFGRQLSPGSAVSVEVKGASQVLPGIVWYRGILPPYLEIWFGVELTVSTRALVKLHFRL